MSFLALFRRWRDRQDRQFPTQEPRGPVHFEGQYTVAEMLRELAPGKQPKARHESV